MADLSLPAGAFAKPAKGTAWLKAKKTRADHVAAEDAIMQSAKDRDGRKCRWPACEFAAKRPRIEACHFHHRGMGGDPLGNRTTRDNLVALCFIHHAQWDRSGEIDIQPQTARGADGCLDFFTRRESGRMELAFSEKAIGVSEVRS